MRRAPDPSGIRGRRNHRLGRIVVGWDGSESAGAAVAFSLELAANAGSEVTLVHVRSRRHFAPSDALAWSAGGEQDGAESARWERELSNLCDCAPDGARVAWRVEHGDPVDRLLQTCADVDADCLLVGSTGDGPLRRRLSIDLTGRLLARASISVMVFPTPAPVQPAADAECVVVALDDSAASSPALELGESLAAHLGARLLLVHVDVIRLPYGVRLAGGPGRTRLRAHARRLLRDARSRVVAPLEAVEEDLREGDVCEELERVCRAHAPALLVTGSRGQDAVRAALGASVSHAMVRRGACPVLVARHHRR